MYIQRKKLIWMGNGSGEVTYPPGIKGKIPLSINKEQGGRVLDFVNHKFACFCCFKKNECNLWWVPWNIWKLGVDE
jgi:hypothetical protein